MARPKFSLITPCNVWQEERREQLYRAIESVEKQTFKDFEYIVINDGSTLDFAVPGWVNLINKTHYERVSALNAGLKQAKGEWIGFLDSDDEIEPNYFERLNVITEAHHEYKMFNFGCTYYHKDGTITKREPFAPKELEVGHEVFGGGNVVNGTFIFNRNVYKKLGGYPKDEIITIDCTDVNYPAYKGQEKPYIRSLFMNTPFDFSAFAQLEFPELRKEFMVDFEAEPEKILKELGNPWGQDFYIWYKYTRKYHSKPIQEYLIKIHPK